MPEQSRRQACASTIPCNDSSALHQPRPMRAGRRGLSLAKGRSPAENRRAPKWERDRPLFLKLVRIFRPQHSLKVRRGPDVQGSQEEPRFESGRVRNDSPTTLTLHHNSSAFEALRKEGARHEAPTE